MWLFDLRCFASHPLLCLFKRDGTARLQLSWNIEIEFSNVYANTPLSDAFQMIANIHNTQYTIRHIDLNKINIYKQTDKKQQQQHTELTITHGAHTVSCSKPKFQFGSHKNQTTKLTQFCCVCVFFFLSLVCVDKDKPTNNIQINCHVLHRAIKQPDCFGHSESNHD